MRIKEKRSSEFENFNQLKLVEIILTSKRKKK